MSDVRLVPVGDADADIRLDRWFRRHFPALKHGRLEKLLRTGQIRVDGGRAKASTRLEPGQTVRVPPLGDEAGTADGGAGVSRRAAISEQDRAWIRSLVIYEDEDVIALNKPPGIAVQGGRKVARHIDGFLDALTGPDGERPRLVHRLDRDTSGVLLVARRARSAAALAEAFKGRDAKKTYWALVVGVPSPRRGTIDMSLLKVAGQDGNERVVRDDAMGKPAVTDYEVIDAAGRKIAWVALYPRTGRTHQLRVHCAGTGTPILGDGKYGGEAAHLDGVPGGDRLHLHARAIELPHPGGGTLRVTAPLPDAMAETWRFFQFSPEGR
jgi:23S rRNA pseudouridine955/2504/2580 synthase